MPLDIGRALTAGLGGGLTQLGQYQQAEKQRKMVEAHQAAQLALQQASQVLESQSIAETLRHNQATEQQEADRLAFLRQKDQGDTQEKLQGMFDSGMARSGIGFANPIAAYNYFNPPPTPEPKVPSVLDPVLNQIGEDRRLDATRNLMTGAGEAFKQAAAQNVARLPIPGTEGFGGAFAINQQYNPSAYMSAGIRVNSGDMRAQAKALNDAQQRIQAAYDAEFTARKPYIGEIEKYDQRQLEELYAPAKAQAELRRRAVATAELAGLQASFPGLAGLTVEQLLGEAAKAGATGGFGQGGTAAPRVNRLLPDSVAGSASGGTAPRKNPLIP